MDGDALTPIGVSGPANGTLVLNGDGTFTYTPNGNFNGSDSFTYKVTDGQAESNVATVAITVNAVNDAPVAANDSATTDEDTATTIPVLANDTDVDGDTLTTVLATGPAHGTVVHNTDGTFTYTPNADFNGTDTFTYRASDGALTSNLATVTITVRPVNDAPVAVNDNYSANEGQLLNVPAAGVLSNDTDVDGNALRAVLVSGPANGTLTGNADGSFGYRPAAGFVGIDTFTYKANDGTADSNVATVSIRVNAIADTEGKVTGGGNLDGGRRRFNIDVQSKANKKQFNLSGLVRFRDIQNHFRLVSTSITGLRVDESGRHAVITGTARVKGRAGYTFTLMVSDLGEPGRGADKFSIQISGPDGFSYDSLTYAMNGGLLDGGNIQVRRRA